MKPDRGAAIAALNAAGVRVSKGRVRLVDLAAAVRVVMGTKMQVFIEFEDGSTSELDSLEAAIAEILDNIDKTVPKRIWEVDGNGEDTGKEWTAKFTVKLIEE